MGGGFTVEPDGCQRRLHQLTVQKRVVVGRFLFIRYDALAKPALIVPAPTGIEAAIYREEGLKLPASPQTHNSGNGGDKNKSAFHLFVLAMKIMSAMASLADGQLWRTAISAATISRSTSEKAHSHPQGPCRPENAYKRG